jgi:hypothetical protein
MLESATFFVVTYMLLAQALFFLYAYPYVKDLTHDIERNGVVAFGGTLVCVIFLSVFLFSAWIGFLSFMFFLISVVSGYELIFWKKARIMNLPLFIFYLAISAFTLAIGDILGRILYLIQAGIWLVGVAEGVKEHLLPLAKSLLTTPRGTNGKYAESFVAIILALCVATIFAPFSGAELPWWIQGPWMLSDAGFAVGGILAYATAKKGIEMIPSAHNPTTE